MKSECSSAKRACFFAGGFLAIARPFPRVRDAQRRGQNQHLPHASFGLGLQDHPAQPWVDRQPGKAAAELGDRAPAVERAELDQQLDAVADAAPVRRIEERELFDIADLQRRHLQQHGGEVRPQDLGLGVARPGREVLLRYNRMHTPGATRPHRPARWAAEACEMGSIGSRCTFRRRL